MYTLGAWLFKAYVGRYPVLLPMRETADVPARIPGAAGSHNERLLSLLRCCLTVDPGARISPSEASIHPYFTTSFVSDFAEGNQVVSELKKKEALLKFIDACSDKTNRLNIKVGWEHELCLSIAVRALVSGVSCD